MTTEPLFAATRFVNAPFVVVVVVVAAAVVVLVVVYCEKWAAGECGELWDSAEELDDELDDEDESVGDGGCEGG